MQMHCSHSAIHSAQLMAYKNVTRVASGEVAGPSEDHRIFAFIMTLTVKTAQANSSFGDGPQSSFFLKCPFLCWTSHCGQHLDAIKRLFCFTSIFPYLLGYKSEVNVSEWGDTGRVEAGLLVLCQIVKFVWVWFLKVQYSGSFEKQVSEYGFRRSPGVSSRRSPAASSNTALQCKPRCHRWRKLQKCPWSKIKCQCRYSLTLLCQQPTHRDQRLHRCSALQFSTYITGKKSLKQYVLRWRGLFWWSRYHYTGKITRPVRSTPASLFPSNPH